MDGSRHLVGGAALLAVLLLPAIAFATVETGSKRDRATASAEAPAERGGTRAIAPGPYRMTCTHHGQTILDARRIEDVAIPPSVLAGALAFRSVEGGASLVLPLQDGSATCVLGQEPEYLRRAARAVERALGTGRAAAWAVGQARAYGNIAPLRNFADASGRPCREFRHTTTIAGHTESTYSVACRGPGSIWQILP
jgi:surface antigen